LDKGGKEVSYLILLVYIRKTILGLKSGVQCFGNKYVFLLANRKPEVFPTGSRYYVEFSTILSLPQRRTCFDKCRVISV